MAHLVHTKVSGGAERAEEEIVQARLDGIERGDPKMAEVSKPDVARAALLVELKELGEAFKSGNIGDICDEAGDVLIAPYTCMLLQLNTKKKTKQLNRLRPDGSQSY